MSLVRCCLLACAVALVIGTARAEDPPFALSEDGTVFVYSARPGDQPGAIARRFGVPAKDVPGFLVANGIADPMRGAIGQVLRIPNPLASRAAEAAARVDVLEREGSELRSRVETLESELGAARARATEVVERAGRLARLERLWALAQGLVALLLLTVGWVAWVALTAARKLVESETYVHTLQLELDDQRRRALAERQEAAKRILDLQAQAHDLTTQLGSARASLKRPTGTHQA